MIKVFNLALKLIKTSFVLIDDRKKASGKKQILFFIVLIALLAPNIFGFSFITYDITRFLVPISQDSVVLALLLQLGVTIIIFSSIFMIPSYMFYAKDIEKLLPLPLTYAQLFLSKLLQVHVYQLGFLLLITLPPLVGYVLAAGLSWSILVFLLSLWLNAFITLIITTLILVIVMSVSPWFKNKDRFTLVMSIFALVVAVYVNYNIGGLDLSNPQAIALSLIQGNQSLSEGFFSFLPHLTLSVSLIVNFSWISWILYLVLSVVFIALVIKLFAPTLVNIMATFQGTGSSKKMSLKSLRGHKIRSVIFALTIKELKLLFRTPVYFFNNVLVVMVLPFLLAFSIYTSLGSITLDDISILLTVHPFIFILSAFALSAIFSMINLVTPTSISREGDNKYHMLLYPVKMSTQLYSKFLSGVIISSIAVLPILLLHILGNILYFKLSWLWVLFALLSALIVMVFMNIFGLVVDVYHPKLVWENEQAAVKQNINFLFTFLTSSALVTLLVYSLFNYPDYIGHIFFFIHGALIIAIFIIHRIIKTKSHDLLIEH